MRLIKNTTELIGIKDQNIKISLVFETNTHLEIQAKLEATNKLIKDIKRLGFGFRNFINFKKRVFITLNIHKKRRPIRSSLDVSFSSPTTVDKHTKISSEEISDGREYSLLFLYVKVVVSCKVVGLYGARRRLTNWQDTLF